MSLQTRASPTGAWPTVAGPVGVSHLTRMAVCQAVWPLVGACQRRRRDLGGVGAAATLTILAVFWKWMNLLRLQQPPVPPAGGAAARLLVAAAPPLQPQCNLREALPRGPTHGAHPAQATAVGRLQVHPLQLLVAVANGLGRKREGNEGMVSQHAVGAVPVAAHEVAVGRMSRKTGRVSRTVTMLRARPWGMTMMHTWRRVPVTCGAAGGGASRLAAGLQANVGARRVA
jgi:hypothetical protein